MNNRSFVGEKRCFVGVLFGKTSHKVDKMVSN